MKKVPLKAEKGFRYHLPVVPCWPCSGPGTRTWRVGSPRSQSRSCPQRKTRPSPCWTPCWSPRLHLSAREQQNSLCKKKINHLSPITSSFLDLNLYCGRSAESGGMRSVWSGSDWGVNNVFLNQFGISGLPETEPEELYGAILCFFFLFIVPVYLSCLGDCAMLMVLL